MNSDDIMDNGTSFIAEATRDTETTNEKQARAWEPNEAPGFANWLGFEPVGEFPVGSTEYLACAVLLVEMQRAKKAARNAPTVDKRLKALGGVASRLARRLDGRHAGFPLVEGDQGDPLYLLVGSARKVVACLTYGKRKYSAAVAMENIAAHSWDMPIVGEPTDIRVEAVQIFHELVQLIVDPQTEAAGSDCVTDTLAE